MYGENAAARLFGERVHEKPLLLKIRNRLLRGMRSNGSWIPTAIYAYPITAHTVVYILTTGANLAHTGTLGFCASQCPPSRAGASQNGGKMSIHEVWDVFTIVIFSTSATVARGASARKHTVQTVQ
jgi:hypothetical protein